MRYIVNKSTDPHYNMALDEFCLQSLNAEEPFFYLWQNSPSVIIGLNQNAYAEVNLPYLARQGILLARRVTGGGAVYHDFGNINYTITGRIPSLETNYPGFMGYVVDALRSLGVVAELSGRNDILVEGRKVSGYAKRVWHDRLMIHGTLMYNVDLDVLSRALSVPGSKLEAAGIESVPSRVGNLKSYLPEISSAKGLMTALEDYLSEGYRDREIVLTQAQLGEVNRIAEEKFRTWEWNYGKSKKAAFSSTRKFACGNVGVDFSVESGRIKGLVFRGDFIGNLPAGELAAVLEGCRYEPSSLGSLLEKEAVEKYFDGLSTQEFLQLLFSV